MILGEIDAGLNLFGKAKALWDKHRNEQTSTPESESLAARFIRLFETHGVHRNQIPRFFGHAISPQDVQTEAGLLVKLDETVLESACAMFAVRREWLDGAETQAHYCHDFYKEPLEFLNFIQVLKQSNPDGQISGVLIAPRKIDTYPEAILILQESIGTIGDKAIYRHHLCHNWNFTYWKARAYLTACVAIAWKANIYIHGAYLDQPQIDKLFEGKVLMGWQGEGIWHFGIKRWNPEDMALNPDVFLKGVDPEKDNHGIKAGLELWLDLEEQGFMAAGFASDARLLFQAALSQY